MQKVGFCVSEKVRSNPRVVKRQETCSRKEKKRDDRSGGGPYLDLRTGSDRTNLNKEQLTRLMDLA